MGDREAWLALAEARPVGAWAAGEVTGGGWLAVWGRSRPGALRADPAAFDPDGPAGTASYVLAEGDVLFDDPAVQRARQLVLAGGPWRVVTTLVSDSTRWRGSLVCGPGDDPFARLGRPRRLEVGPGLLSAGPARLPAPVIERYAGRPWPQAGFTRSSGRGG